jgi:hypothetical protein
MTDADDSIDSASETEMEHYLLQRGRRAGYATDDPIRKRAVVLPKSLEKVTQHYTALDNVIIEVSRHERLIDIPA